MAKKSLRLDPNSLIEFQVNNSNSVKALGFTMTYNAVIFDPELSDGAARTLQAFYSYADGRANDKAVWPSHKAIATRRGTNVRTISRHKDELARLGYIEILERRDEGKTSLITLIDPCQIERLQQLANDELARRGGNGAISAIKNDSTLMTKPSSPDDKNVPTLMTKMSSPDDKNVTSPDDKNVLMNKSHLEQELEQQQQPVVVENSLNTKDTSVFEEKLQLLNELGLALNNRTRQALQVVSIELLRQYVVYAMLNPKMPKATFIEMMENNTPVAIDTKRVKEANKAESEKARARAYQAQINAMKQQRIQAVA